MTMRVYFESDDKYKGIRAFPYKGTSGGPDEDYYDFKTNPILDGAAIKGKGSSSRGARYNSAIRYIYGARTDQTKGECLAVVVSKDGTVNLIRELHQRILRSEVTKRLEAIRIATADERVSAKEYYKAIFWLDGQRFYLSAEQCNELNELKEATKPRLIAQEGWARTPREFVPDEEMDESYFLDESDS